MAHWPGNPWVKASPVMIAAEICWPVAGSVWFQTPMVTMTRPVQDTTMIAMSGDLSGAFSGPGIIPVSVDMQPLGRSSHAQSRTFIVLADLGFLRQSDVMSVDIGSLRRHHVLGRNLSRPLAGYSGSRVKLADRRMNRNDRTSRWQLMQVTPEKG